MAKTAIIFSPKYYEHNTGPDHPESPKRLAVIIRELEKLQLVSSKGNCRLVQPGLATIEDLELVHDPEHVQLVKRVCEGGGGLLDLGDTVVSPKSFDVSRFSVGGVIKAVNLVMGGKYRNAFALVRPPGHHAGPYYAAGFCVFNNIAIAATHLIRRLHLERVLILDVDAHHGNGTQEIFYKTKKTLYISLHEDPRVFPGTGFVEEIGEGEGLGYTVNIPFPFKTGDKSYLKAVDHIVVPIVREFSPQFILVSAGFDGYHGDPVAKLNLSNSAYAHVFSTILDLASTICGDRFVAVLEGGYNLSQLGKLVTSTISKMANLNYSVKDGDYPTRPRAEKRAEKVIKRVKKTHSTFWGSLHS